MTRHCAARIHTLPLRQHRTYPRTPPSITPACAIAHPPSPSSQPLCHPPLVPHLAQADAGNKELTLGRPTARELTARELAAAVAPGNKDLILGRPTARQLAAAVAPTGRGFARAMLSHYVEGLEQAERLGGTCDYDPFSAPDPCRKVKQVAWLDDIARFAKQAGWTEDTERALFRGWCWRGFTAAGCRHRHIRRLCNLGPSRPRGVAYMPHDREANLAVLDGHGRPPNDAELAPLEVLHRRWWDDRDRIVLLHMMLPLDEEYAEPDGSYAWEMHACILAVALWSEGRSGTYCYRGATPYWMQPTYAGVMGWADFASEEAPGWRMLSSLPSCPNPHMRFPMSRELLRRVSG